MHRNHVVGHRSGPGCVRFPWFGIVLPPAVVWNLCLNLIVLVLCELVCCVTLLLSMPCTSENPNAIIHPASKNTVRRFLVNSYLFLMSESGRSSVVSDGAEDVAVAANPTDLIQPLQELVERMMSVGLRSVE